jgi:hypothetical protein
MLICSDKMLSPEPEASMRRWEFFGVLGGAAWPLAARAQQTPMPVIGFLSVTFAREQLHWLTAFRQGLREEWSQREL